MILNTAKIKNVTRCIIHILYTLDLDLLDLEIIGLFLS